jgi:integrase
MFRWALSQDIVEADPTAALTPYDRGAPRDRVLTVEEIELVWKWFESDALSLEGADILKLELLTGARSGEISGLRAEEIDKIGGSRRTSSNRGMVTYSLTNRNCARVRDYERSRTAIQGLRRDFRVSFDLYTS